MRLIRRLLTLLIIVVSCGVCNSFAVPECDADRTREDLLKLTPPSSSMEAVIEAIRAHNWTPRPAKVGYLDERTGKQIGLTSINALVTECHESTLAITSLTAYWGFDVQRKLIDIQVLKTVDAP